MVSKISDTRGEAWVSAFNEEAEKIVGCSANELDKLKSEHGDIDGYQQKWKEATWVPHLFRVSVAQNEYNNENRKIITVRVVAPINLAKESKFLFEDIKKMRNSHYFQFLFVNDEFSREL